MRMPRHDLPDIPITHCEIQASPRGELSHVLPVNLLPRRIIPDLLRLQIPPAPLDLLIADQHIHPPRTQIDPDLVACLENPQVPPHGRLR